MFNDTQKRAWIGGWSNWFNCLNSSGGALQPANSYQYNVDGPKWVRVGVDPSGERYDFAVRFTSLEEPLVHESTN